MKKICIKNDGIAAYTTKITDEEGNLVGRVFKYTIHAEHGGITKAVLHAFVDDIAVTADANRVLYGMSMAGKEILTTEKVNDVIERLTKVRDQVAENERSGFAPDPALLNPEEWYIKAVNGEITPESI